MEKKDIAIIAFCVIVMVIAFQNLKPTMPPPGQEGLYSEEVQGPQDGTAPEIQPADGEAPDRITGDSEPEPAEATESIALLAAEFADLEAAQTVTLTAGDYATYTFEPEAGGLSSVDLTGLDMTVGHPDLPMLAIQPEGSRWRFSHARILEQTETTLRIARQVLDQPLIVEQGWTIQASDEVPYVVDYEVTIRNIGDVAAVYNNLTIQSGVMHDLGTPKGFMGAGGIDQTVDLRYAGDKSPKSLQLKKIKDKDEEDEQKWRETPIDWIAVQNKYFTSIVDPADEGAAFAGSILSSRPVIDIEVTNGDDTYVGHVLRQETSRRSLTVQLESSDPNAVSVPPSVTIAPGNSAATFAIGRGNLPPDTRITLTANAEGYASSALAFPPTGKLPKRSEVQPLDDLILGSVVLETIELAPGETQTRRMQVYIGPKKYELLDKLGDNKTSLMRFDLFLFFHLKAFEYISLIIFWLLTTFHSIFNSYGIAILLITLILRLLFWPITHRSTMMSRKMQQIAPLAKEMREKHKGDPQKLHQKTMELYKEHKVNPMSGCLPALLQIPAFFALFNVLRSAMELRHASFLWAHDLSLPDTVAVVPLLFIELPINPLAIIMGVTMILQMKVVPTTADPSQQRIMMIMSGSFLIFLYTMPSGLTLYWAANQILNIIQYRITHNMMDKDEAAKTAKAKT